MSVDIKEPLGGGATMGIGTVIIFFYPMFNIRVLVIIASLELLSNVMSCICSDGWLVDFGFDLDPMCALDSSNNINHQTARDRNRSFYLKGS